MMREGTPSLLTAISRHRTSDNRWRLVSGALLTLAAVYVGISLALIGLGPWSVTVAGLRIGATDVFKPISVALVALVAACAFQPWARAAWRGRSSLAFYLLAAAFLFLCSFGPAPTFLGEQILYKPPYAWLMNLPLFAGLEPAELDAILSPVHSHSIGSRSRNRRDECWRPS